jgi:antitoxin VapB
MNTNLPRKCDPQRHSAVTGVAVQSPQAECRSVAAQRPLAERLDVIADELAAIAKPGGREMSKGEIDAMWGNSAHTGLR